MSDAVSWQKESFSVAYLAAWASRAGAKILNAALCSVDDEAVDVTLARGGQKVDVQLKCTHKERLIDKGLHHSHPLDNRAYNLLRQPDRALVAYLALVTVPKDVEEWINSDDEGILLKGSGFYVCMEGMPDPTGKEHTVVRIPVGQRIDSAALDLMFKRSRDRVLYGIYGTAP